MRCSSSIHSHISFVSLRGACASSRCCSHFLQFHSLLHCMALHSSVLTKTTSFNATKINPSDGSATDSSSPSPPLSPRRCRKRLRSKVQARIRPVRNIRYLSLLCLLYVSGFIMCAGPFSSWMRRSSDPGAVYRSHELFRKLRPEIEADNSTAIQLASLWQCRKKMKLQRPCPNSTARQNFAMYEESSGPSGYLIVEANGGLNQQRSAICNAVAVAGLLNAALVMPSSGFNSVRRDPSEFHDIYDQDHFITALEDHVKVVKKLPDELMKRYNYTITNITNFHINAWAPANYYLRTVHPVLQDEGVIRIAPFANSLAMNVPPHIQLLRCITNYKALRFSSPISTLAQKLVDRMIKRSSRTGGKYVSVHLRFEEDTLASSCCVYDGGAAEKLEMDSLRETGWKGKFKRKVITPGLNRIDGKCPLTPLEVGMMLRGMGFDSNTSIYLASGKIYQAERHLAPLLKMFPLLYSKESLATPDELAPFEGYSSRLAALDYSVCLLSEVFVTTQGGNFPHFLMGHRRFLFDGHAKTIKPDKRKLVVLLQDMSISWKIFKDQMKAMLSESDRKGMMVPRVRRINRKTSVYTYPLPECSCLQPHSSSSLRLTNTTNNLDSQFMFLR